MKMENRRATEEVAVTAGELQLRLPSICAITNRKTGQAQGSRYPASEMPLGLEEFRF
jgi:hypothetical protein